MRNYLTVIFRLIAAVGPILVLSGASAAPLTPSPEDRYVATRDAAIAKFSPIYDAGNSGDATTKAEDAAFADLRAQMAAILAEPDRKGFGPAKLNLETFYKGDEGFGTLDGLRFDSELGANGEKAGQNGADGKYVEPGAHIIVTTQTLFARWLRAHKDWWDKESKNVPQQIGKALRDESFYTQAIPTDSAVINFNSLSMAKPVSATFAYGFLAGRTQSDIPNAADEVFVSALANGKVYIAYGSIAPKVEVSRPAWQSGPTTTRRRRTPTTNSGPMRSAGKPTTSWATSASRAKTPTSAVLFSARRSSRHLPRPPDMDRLCWRWPWKAAVRVPVHSRIEGPTGKRRAKQRSNPSPGSFDPRAPEQQDSDLILRSHAQHGVSKDGNTQAAIPRDAAEPVIGRAFARPVGGSSG
jgi:hypothetical protein